MTSLFQWNVGIHPIPQVAAASIGHDVTGETRHQAVRQALVEVRTRHVNTVTSVTTWDHSLLYADTVVTCHLFQVIANLLHYSTHLHLLGSGVDQQYIRQPAGSRGHLPE